MILTRPTAETAELALALRARGHEVLELPCIETEPVADAEALIAALRTLGPGDRLIVTSLAGARAVIGAMQTINATVAPVAPVATVATVGARAASALREAGCCVDVVASTGHELAATVPIPPGVVLLARSDRALNDLPSMLAARGARVREVVAYLTVQRVSGDVSRAEALLAGGASLVVSSPSAFDALVERVGSAAVSRARLIATGPTTAELVRQRTGREVAVTEWDRLSELFA